MLKKHRKYIECIIVYIALVIINPYAILTAKWFGFLIAMAFAAGGIPVFCNNFKKSFQESYRIK